MAGALFAVILLQDSPAELEKKLCTMIDGYVLPTFDPKPFRDELKAAAHANLVMKLFRYVDREALNIEGRIYLLQLDMPALGDRPTESQKREADLARKKIAVLEKQLHRLEDIRTEMVGALHMLPSDEAAAILVAQGPKFKRQEARVAFVETVARNAQPRDAPAISHLFLVEQDFLLIERYVPAFLRLQTASEPAIRKLCAMAEDVRYPRGFRRACVKSIGELRSPIALPFLVKLLDYESVASNVEDALLKIIGAQAPYFCGRMP